MNRRAEGAAATAQIAGFSTILMNYYLPDFVNTGFGKPSIPFSGRRTGRTGFWAPTSSTSRPSGKICRPPTRSIPSRPRRRCRRSNTGFAVLVVGSATGDASKIYSPFGSKPNYTNMQQVSFDNADERLWAAALPMIPATPSPNMSFQALASACGIRRAGARVTRPPESASGPQRTLLGCNTARHRVRSRASASKPSIRASGR